MSCPFREHLNGQRGYQIAKLISELHGHYSSIIEKRCATKSTPRRVVSIDSSYLGRQPVAYSYSESAIVDATHLARCEILARPYKATHPDRASMYEAYNVERRLDPVITMPYVPVGQRRMCVARHKLRIRRLMSWAGSTQAVAESSPSLNEYLQKYW